MALDILSSMSDETQVIDERDPEGYDEWFRREVELGLKEAHAPGAVVAFR